MSDMVERVTEVICVLNSACGEPCGLDGCICRAVASAAIEAMLEPTGEMLAAGVAASRGCPTELLGYEVKQIWKDMAEEALK